MVLVLAAAALAVGVGSAVMSAQGAAASGKAGQRQQDAQMWGQIGDRNRAIDYATEQFARDISYATETLEYSKTEFTRQTATVDRARKTVQRNTSQEVSAVLTRQIEEDMASILGGISTKAAGNSARGTLRAQSGDRGVEGNSVEAIIQDVFRQEGEALNVQAMNRSATDRALTRQAIVTRATGTQQMMNMGVQTYAPQQQVRVAAPMQGVVQPAPVPQPNMALQIGMGAANAAVGAFNSYSRWTGQTGQQTFDQASGWLTRQFRIGG